MFDISTDLNSFLQSLNALPDKIEAGTEKGLDRAAKVTLDAKAGQVKITYARPIPRGKNGKPKWERKGNFQGDQTIVSSKGQRTIKAVGESEKYEARLANLPTGADGVNRTNKAAEKAFQQVEPQILPLIEQEIANELDL